MRQGRDGESQEKAGSPKILLTAKKLRMQQTSGGWCVGRENRNDGDMKRGRIEKRFCVWPQHQFKTKVTA